MTRALPADIARCPGSGSDAEGWREGCETCQRRTSPSDHQWQPWMQPPAIIELCPYEIKPDMTDKPQTGRPLAPERMEVVSIRLTAAQKEALKRIGHQAIRDYLDKQ